jgi:hydroxymethylpyrimidine pyrophosphatase-like HAD family hydrolase
VADDLGGDLPLVLHNGALVVEGGEILVYRPLAREVARRAVRVGRSRGASAVLHCGRLGEGRLVVEEEALGSPTLLAYSVDRSNPDLVTVSHIERALDDDPVQVMFGGSLDEMASLHATLAAELAGEAHVVQTVYPASGVALIDILDPGVHKGAALAFLVERYGVSPSETLAIGDNWNDREMLLSAGLGLVMGNAEPGMLGFGLPILPTNDDDGVAWAIERHIFQN